MPGDRVLDIGCGPGAALEHAHSAGAQVSAVDPTPGMVKRASARVPDATVVLGSAEHLEFEDETFDIVWSLSAYHHWAYPETAFQEIQRVLRSGGRLYIVEDELRDGKTGHGLDRHDAEELSRDLGRHQFTDTRVEAMKPRRKTYLVISGVK
jgi:ubiquinone/menaquinone biosynthesis C-methylase UbiE